MLARRQEQENLINEHQTAAAAKPLNQDVRAAKTPGKNLVSKSNVPLKSVARGDENVRTVAKQKENAYITPLGPRQRVPLGAKTTNAKSKAFQTPAPLTGGQGWQRTQRPSGSARKAKLKVHQPEAVEADPISQNDNDDDEDVPDVEYCPPKITELPDIPDLPNAFAEDETFPQLQGLNFIAGAYSLYCNPIGEDGLSQSERLRKERRAELDEYAERELQKSMEEFRAEYEVPERVSARASSGPSNARSKAAAEALSRKSQPGYAAPTAAAKARLNPSISTRPNKTAALASRSTIGYAKGRKVSAGMKESAVDASSTSNRPKTFWERFDENVEKDEQMRNELLSRDSNELEGGDEDDGEIVIPWLQAPDDLYVEHADNEPYVFQFQRHEE